MIFVSHDRMFLRGLSNRVLELGGESGTDATLHAYPGSYIEYVQRTGHEAPGVHALKSCQVSVSALTPWRASPAASAPECLSRPEPLPRLPPPPEPGSSPAAVPRASG